METIKIKVGNKTFKGTKSEILAHCSEAIAMYERIIGDGGRGVMERSVFFLNGWKDVKNKLEASNAIA